MVSSRFWTDVPLSMQRENGTRSSYESASMAPVSTTTGNRAPNARMRRNSSLPFNQASGNPQLQDRTGKDRNGGLPVGNDKERLSNHVSQEFRREFWCLQSRRLRTECDVCDLVRVKCSQAIP